MAVNRNLILNGIGGEVWLNGKKLAYIKKVEAKLTGDFEDVNFCGDTATYSLFNGWSGEGSMSAMKVDSEVAAMMVEAYTTGIMPDIKIITKIENKSTKKTERWAINDVVFTEIAIANFESKGSIEEELPFKFSACENIEKIKN